MTTTSENSGIFERTESERLLDAQDAENADKFLMENYAAYGSFAIPNGILVVIGRLLRENRMLSNLAKSNDSANPNPKLQTSHPPFSKPPEFIQPCVSVDRAAGRIRDRKIPRPSTEFDLNPASIRRVDSGQMSFQYRKPNAGKIRT